MADSLNLNVQQSVNDIGSGGDNNNMVSKKQDSFSTRYVYNSKCVSKNVEYEMVRPLSHSITIFRQVMNGNGRLTYADIVKSARGSERGTDT